MASPPNKVFLIDPKLYQRQAFGAGHDGSPQSVRHQQQCSAGPSAAAGKIHPFRTHTQSGWKFIPSVILIAIAKHLPIADRKTCTLVCRRWNDVIFGNLLNNIVTFPLSKWQSERYVLFNGFHPTMQRPYRKVEVSWINFPDVQYLIAINKLFETLPKYGLQRLTINAQPDETLGDFFERHHSTWNHIKELHVNIGSPFNQYPLQVDDANLDIRKCSITMPALQCLKWIEATLGNICHGRQYFLITAPQLAYAKVHTFRHWNCYSVLNIKSCSNLRNAFLDIPNRIWRTFQINSFHQLQTLNFTTESREYAIENIAPVQFDDMFAAMRNLQAVKISGPVDAPLVAICHRCPLIWSVELSRFTVGFAAFLKLSRLTKLKNLSLTHGKITATKGRIVCESLQSLWLRDVELADGEFKEFPLKLNNFMKSKLIYTKHENSVVCNYSTC